VGVVEGEYFGFVGYGVRACVCHVHARVVRAGVCAGGHMVLVFGRCVFLGWADKVGAEQLLHLGYIYSLGRLDQELGDC
jgi:hypothetical protein